jgi:predicted nucleic acid-binding protein
MKKIRVFLDTNVIIKYLREGTPKTLFSPATFDRVTYIINPVVLQELFLASARHQANDNWKELTDKFEIDGIEATLFDNDAVKRLLKIRNHAVHSSDFLIMASAASSDCDYLLSYDRDILNAADEIPYLVMTPDDFVEMLEETA